MRRSATARTGWPPIRRFWIGTALPRTGPCRGVLEQLYQIFTHFMYIAVLTLQFNFIQNSWCVVFDDVDITICRWYQGGFPHSQKIQYSFIRTTKHRFFLITGLKIASRAPHVKSRKNKTYILIHTSSRSRIPKVESRREHAEREGTNAEGHVEALAEAEAREPGVVLRLRALAHRPRGHLLMLD